MFSIFNSVLLAPLPYPDPDALVMVFDTQPACSTSPASFPKYHDWKSRIHVFAALGGSTEASFVLTGRSDPEQVGGVYTTASLMGGRSTFGNGIVVAEIALAFALLVGAGLLLKNLMLLEQRDAGVQTSRILAFDVAVAGNRYKADEQQSAFFREAVDRLRAIGGVEAVGATSHLPMYRFGWNGEMSIEGGNPWSPRDAPLVENRWIAGGYFKTMSIPLVQGRLFDARDRKGDTQVVVINRAMAEKFWPGRDPIGRRLAPGSSTDWWQVVGIVGNVRSFGLASRFRTKCTGRSTSSRSPR